jgi:hypothetical protein
VRRFALVAAAVGAVLIGGAGPAAATPYLDAKDATSLAGLLAEASEAQGGVCYGWILDLSDAAGTDGTDAGSNRGVGTAPSDVPECTRYVQVEARVTWVSESSESEDSAAFTVASEGLSNPPTASDVRSAVGMDGDDLKNDDGDVLLYRAVAALPRLLADAGEVPSVSLTPAASAPPSGTDPTGSRTPDWVRQQQGWLVTGLVLVFVSVTIVLIGFYLRGAERRRLAAAAEIEQMRQREAAARAARKGGRPGQQSGRHARAEGRTAHGVRNQQPPGPPPRTGPAPRTGPTRTGPASAGPTAQPGPAQPGPAQPGPGQPGPAQPGNPQPGNTGPFRSTSPTQPDDGRPGPSQPDQGAS